MSTQINIACDPNQPHFRLALPYSDAAMSMDLLLRLYALRVSVTVGVSARVAISKWNKILIHFNPLTAIYQRNISNVNFKI